MTMYHSSRIFLSAFCYYLLAKEPSQKKFDYPTKTKTLAFAGSRTRVYCLEGNYPNRWTTNAFCCLTYLQKDYTQLQHKLRINIIL